jgi:CRP-like cAMP-binding protein
MIACMSPVIFPAGSLVIKQGDQGNVLYIVERGILEVFNEAVSGRRLGKGSLFGELALLYNCTRTASVRVLSQEELAAEGIYSNGDAHLWALERTAFQHVMVERGLRKRSAVVNFLRSVKLFADLDEEALSKVVDVSSEREYMPGDYIVREGARGDTFFVIQSGGVRVTKNSPEPSKLHQQLTGQTCLTTANNNTPSSEIFLRRLGRGEYFGEKALTATTPTKSPLSPREGTTALRTANVIAEEGPDGSGVTCLVIDRETFHQLIQNKVQGFERPDLPE